MKWLKSSSVLAKQLYDIQLLCIRTLIVIYYLCMSFFILFEYVLVDSKFTTQYKNAEYIAYYLLALVNCYIAIYILLRYNNWAFFLPFFFETTYDFTELDRIIVYHAGVAVFFQTVFPKILGHVDPLASAAASKSSSTS